MTRDDIIRMAREAGFTITGNGRIESPYIGGSCLHYPLSLFAAQVAAAERDKVQAKANAEWKLMCQKMVAAERESCAKVCDEYANYSSNPMNFAANCADAIRARSQA